MNKWFEGTPNSYKIQLEYIELPAQMELQRRYMDAPFRFRNYEEAEESARDIFDGMKVRIVGSSDNPHWQINRPASTKTSKDLKDMSWYQLHGVSQIKPRSLEEPTKPSIMSENLQRMPPVPESENVVKQSQQE
jgi:hypothetical protein